MMLDRMEGNAELKTSVQQMLATRRLTHSVLLVGEAGLGTGFAARCIAADYLYPAGGAAAEALLRGECCRAVAKAGKRDSGTVETGIVREAISVSGMGSGGKYLVGQVTAMRSEIFNTSLSAEGRAVLLYHVERMNEESANALLKVMEEPPEGVLFLLTADSLTALLAAFRRTGRVACLEDESHRGNPAVFPAACFDELLALRGDCGAKGVLRAHGDELTVVSCRFPGELADADEPQALALLRGRLAQRGE